MQINRLEQCKYVTDTSFYLCQERVWGPLVLSFYCLFLLENQLFKDIFKNLSELHRTFSCGMWDLVPRSRIEPGPPALGVRMLSHWNGREVATGVMVYGGRNCPGGQVTSLRSHGELESEPGFKAWSSGTRTQVPSPSLQDPAKGSRAGDPDSVALKPPNSPIHLTRQRRASCFPTCSQSIIASFLTQYSL